MPFNMTIRWPSQPESARTRTVWPNAGDPASRYTQAMSVLRARRRFIVESALGGDMSGRLTDRVYAAAPNVNVRKRNSTAPDLDAPPDTLSTRRRQLQGLLSGNPHVNQCSWRSTTRTVVKTFVESVA